MRGARAVAVLASLVLGLGLILVGPGTARAAGACAEVCITDVTVTRGPFAATVQVKTDVDTTLAVLLTDRPPGTPGGAPPRIATSDTFAKAHAVTFLALDAGTTYYLTISATDRKANRGRTQQDFTTQFRVVRPEIYKIKILDDADTPGKGEIFVEGFAYGNLFSIATADLHTGDYWYLRQSSTFYGPGASMPLLVHGEECDTWSNGCITGDYSADRADARVTIDVDHPGEGGTSRKPQGDMPAGHDGYVLFETLTTYLRFRVYAFWDISYVD